MQNRNEKRDTTILLYPCLAPVVEFWEAHFETTSRLPPFIMNGGNLEVVLEDDALRASSEGIYYKIFSISRTNVIFLHCWNRK